jgi:hypothetical protein
MSPRALAPFVAFSLALPACTPTSAAGTNSPPSAEPAPASATAAASGAACWPWEGRGFALKVDAFAMTPQNVMVLSYDDASGAARVRASGTFVKDRQAVDRTLELAEAEREAVAQGLLAICPDDKARAARCAPGGCSRVEVTPRGGATRSVENDAVVNRIIDRLTSLFPELR